MSDKPTQSNLDSFTDKLTAPARSDDAAGGKHNAFEDAYKDLKSAGHAILNAVEHHPLASAGAALVGGVVLFDSLGGDILGRTTKTAAEGLADKTVQEGAAGAERDRVLKQVGQIPDVERPSLSGAPLIPEQFTRAANAYKGAITELKNMPTAQIMTDAQDLSAVAKQTIERRVSITGERVTDQSVAEETKRLAELNPGLSAESGKAIAPGTKVELYNHNDLGKLAEKTQFKYVPQLGQFLKENGVTEEQIEKALAVQKAQPEGAKKLLGQILTDEGLATKQQVDAAFGKQGEMKKVLAEVRKAQGF